MLHYLYFLPWCHSKCGVNKEGNTHRPIVQPFHDFWKYIIFYISYWNDVLPIESDVSATIVFQWIVRGLWGDGRVHLYPHPHRLDPRIQACKVRSSGPLLCVFRNMSYKLYNCGDLHWIFNLWPSLPWLFFSPAHKKLKVIIEQTIRVP